MKNDFISVHYTTILRELAYARYSVKQLKRIAAEHSEDKRVAYIYCVAEYTQEQLGFLNETSKDEKTPGHCRGRAKRGRRAERRQVFIHGCQLMGTGLLTVDGIVTSTVIEGSMTTESFCKFLEENVVCKLAVHVFPYLTFHGHIIVTTLLSISRETKCAGDGQCEDPPWSRHL